MYEITHLLALLIMTGALGYIMFQIGKLHQNMDALHLLFMNHILNEEKTASPELKKFFERLLSIKEEVNTQMNLTQDPFLRNIYSKLHQTIKEKTND